MFCKIFQNIVEKRTFSTSFFDTSNTLITKLDQDTIKKKHYKSISLMDRDTMIVNKILTD